MQKLSQKSFTLLELLIVIAVIAILAGIIIVAVSGTRQRAIEAEGLQFSHSIKSSNSNDLYAEWNFDDLDNPLKDVSGNNYNDGTFTGAPLSVKGKVRNALLFEGNEYINLNDTNNRFDFTDKISIELWFYPKAFTSTYACHPIRKWNGGVSDANFSLYFFGDYNGAYPTNKGILAFYANRGGAWGCISTSSTYYKITKLEQWYHIFFTYSSTDKGKFYINGKMVTSTGTGLGNLANNNYPLQIGGSTTDFNGIIDEVRIYGSALTAKEIQKLYAEGEGRHVATNSK